MAFEKGYPGLIAYIRPKRPRAGRARCVLRKLQHLFGIEQNFGEQYEVDEVRSTWAG